MMKKYFKYFLISFGIFSPLSVFSESLTKIEYEELINELICDFTDFALSHQKRQPHYADFKKDVGTCDYYTAMEFLKARKTLPKYTPEIVNIIFYEYYIERFNEKSTNEEHYNILISMFDEEEFKGFSKSFTSSFPGFKTDTEGKIRERLGVGEYEEENIPEEFIDASDSIAIQSEFDEITESNEPVEEIKVESPNDYYTDNKDEIEATSELKNLLIFVGWALIVFAIALYFWYSRRLKKIRSPKSQVAASPTPQTVTPPKPVVKRTPKSIWGKVTTRISKKKTYQDNIDEIQQLIQSHQQSLATIRADIEVMHQKISQLAQLAEKKEIIGKRLKELTEQLNEIEAKEQTLLVILDDTIANETEKNDEDKDNAHLKIEHKEVVQETTVTPVIDPINHPPTLFFMPIPNADGSFDFRDWSENFEKGRSFYRFEMFNNVEAKFVFYDYGTNANEAIANPEQYLLPVCKIADIDFKNPSKIVVQNHNPGIVYKDGDTWRLKKKAMVYFQ